MQIDWGLLIHDFTRIGIAYFLAVPIGWDRERFSESAGLRTFPLVAIGACGFALTGLSVFGNNAEANARVLYGLMTGIGFIGGGAIIRRNEGVSGTATAAALWITGAIGAAVAWGKFELAFLLAAVSFITMRYARRFKSPPDAKRPQSIPN